MIRIILVDDHRHIHQIVTTILSEVDDISIIAQGSNGKEAIQLCQAHQPDLVLMDVVMPEMNGADATRHIHAKFPDIRILVLSSFRDHESVHEMLRGGANGYVTKGSLTTDLINSIRATHEGQAVFSQEVAAQLLSAVPVLPARHFDLTDRELEVLGLMAEGLNNKEIGQALTISRSTVKFHIANILHKMGVDTRAEALVLAAKHNLV